MDEQEAVSEPTRTSQQHPRYAMRLPVRMSTIDAEIDRSTGEAYFASTQEFTGNLSCGGLYIPIEEGMTPGRRVLVEVDLPDGETIQTVGRVAWSRIHMQGVKDDRPSGVGIEFNGSRSQHARTLADFLDKHARRRAQRPQSSGAVRHITP
jgi:Tfp pilus assembly protein PilZ